MSFSRVKPSGWAVSESLTSGQQNQLDTNVSNSCDKRSGQTDTLQGTYTFNTGTVTLAGTTTISGALSASNVSQCQMSGTNRITYVSRAITRFMPGNGYAGAWTVNSSQNWTNGTSGADLTVPLNLPNGNVLDTVTVRYQGATGHGAFPGGAPVMPIVKVYRLDSTGAATQLATFTDNSATAGAYEAIHDISVTAIAHTIDTTANRYFMRLTAESGANFIANAVYYYTKATCTITNGSEWL